MSSAKKPAKDPSPLAGTRQMLDELDALMERMLALPVEEPPPPPNVRIPTVAATLTLLDEPDESALQTAELDEQPAEAEISQPPPIRRPASYFTEPGERLFAKPSAADVTPLEDVDPLADELLPPSMITVQRQDIEPRPMPWLSLGHLALKPLLWTNQGFDRCTLLLGGPGRWLRSAGGRNFLGWTGLFLLAVAAGWLIKDWLGWNQ